MGLAEGLGFGKDNFNNKRGFMGKLSREKGKRGERELAALFRKYGYGARRGQQFAGSPDSPDVVTDLEWLHVECKRTEVLNVYKALEQAETDAGMKLPVVFHRKNKQPWVAILRAEEFLSLIRQA